jgi:hypothetical protein
MPKNFVKNSFWIAIALVCATRMSYAQADPTVHNPFPAGSALVNIEPNADGNMTMAGEYKQPKNVVAEQQEVPKWWSITGEVGYESKYIFRGTNLTPNSDGLEFQQVIFSAKGFTLGAWFGVQLGDAVVKDATVLGEAGGGFSPFGLPAIQARDTAIQSRFKELDVFSSYSHSFGWVDVTAGNIAFFIWRSEIDQYRRFGQPPPFNIENFSVPEDEVFDRLFISLSTSKIHPFGIAIIPTVTYYQTIYNHGDCANGKAAPSSAFSGIVGPSTFGQSCSYYNVRQLGFIRNEEEGGYLEGKIQAVIPIVRTRTPNLPDVLRLEPTALISYSFGDRSEGTNITQQQFFNSLANGTPLSTSTPLFGFNHFQAGAELVFQATRWLSVTGFGDYAYHIAEPTAGTHKNEWWGGGKVTVSF